MTEKSEFREMRSFDLAIRRAYFKAQIRRNYAKNVVINRSDKVQIFSHISKYVSNEKVENYMLSQCHKDRDFFLLLLFSVLVYFMIWK